MKLTDLSKEQIDVLEAYMASDTVSDCGWNSLESSAWLISNSADYHFGMDCGMTGKKIERVVEGMEALGIVKITHMSTRMSNREVSFSLTKLGVDICFEIEADAMTKNSSVNKSDDRVQKEFENITGNLNKAEQKKLIGMLIASL